MKVPLSIRAALHGLGVDAPARILGARMTRGQYAYIAQALERIYRELNIADLIPLEREDSDACLLYLRGRLIGDLNAVRRGTIGRRIARRTAGG